MRFLIDANLSPALAAALAEDGHDAVHVADVLAADAADEAVFNFAAAHARVIVSADTDFGDLLARRTTTKPSLILFRRHAGRRAEDQRALLAANLEAVEQDLADGAVVVIDAARLRIRKLPVQR